MSWPRLAIGLIAALALIWAFGPRDRLRPMADTPPAPPDIEAWLAERDAGIRPEVASYMQWAGDPGERTETAILYIHGFAATPAELRPMPEDLARTLGANLLAIRLTGHGQGPDDLAAARAQDWWRDVGQGLAAAHQLGDRVIVLGMSTGATLASLAARDADLGRRIDGLVLISPNFSLRGWRARLLDLPFARLILKAAGNPTRCFVVRNDLHATRWTPCYPVSAALPVGAVLRSAREADVRHMRVPALFVWSDGDRIVDHKAGARVAADWGATATAIRVLPGPRDDPDAHVIAGEALSPDLSSRITTLVADWVARLPD